jgi:hypothetical protein
MRFEINNERHHAFLHVSAQVVGRDHTDWSDCFFEFDALEVEGVGLLTDFDKADEYLDGMLDKYLEDFAFGHDWSESFADKLAAMADDAMDRMKEGDL